MHKMTMLGAGFISRFYTQTLHAGRGQDRVDLVYSHNAERVKQAAQEWQVRRWTTDMAAAINDPETSVVVIGLPNYLHKDAVLMAAQAGKAILCTKPLGRTGAEAREMLEAVEKAGVFHGYLEDLVYTPKSLKAIKAVRAGAVGKVLWTRARETHGGPHSAWFLDRQLAGGGAIIDMGCHCIEIGRAFIGKDIKPLEVMCWAATQVHPINAEDNAIGLVRYESGAIGQFEVSWCFRGGMDLRDEVAGTEGTIWLNHFLRTGFEMFSASGSHAYVAEKAETDKGWLFPVGDEAAELGYVPMFNEMLDSIDRKVEPMETFYDGYVVNAIMDSCYRSAQSKQWEPIDLPIWRGTEQVVADAGLQEYDAAHLLVKEEVMPDGRTKIILKEKASGKIVDRVS